MKRKENFFFITPTCRIESELEVQPWCITLGIDQVVHMPDGSNVKYSIAQTMDKLQKKMLSSSAEDDTKSLFAIIQVSC